MHKPLSSCQSSASPVVPLRNACQSQRLTVDDLRKPVQTTSTHTHHTPTPTTTAHNKRPLVAPSKRRHCL